MENRKYWNKHFMQRFSICILLSMAFACAVFPRCRAYAASTPTLSASADVASVAAGQTVDIKVNLSNNPAVSTLGMALNYDSSVLQYTGSTWNSAFGSSDMTLVSDDGGSVNMSVVCDDAYTVDGVVVTVRFEAVSDASAIPVSLALRDITDSSLSAVNCKVSSELHVPDAGGAEEAPEPDTASPVTDKQAAPADSVSSSQASEQSTASASGNGTDENYKTGAGFGNDIYLMIAAFCGILALAVICRNEKNCVK